jgi:2-polyprenyl-3-methyl-5-hydroxy-6-metoxy-1,4-benzoquinol methylase
MVAACQGHGLRLLPRSLLVKTSSLDQSEWVYRPVLGAVQRMRFSGVASLLGAQSRAPRLLEIGYGSGILMPELARHCDQLYGLDAHPYAAAVAERLTQVGVSAMLVTGDACSLPYRDGSFDTVVVVSVLEFVADVFAAVREVIRVLTPRGIAIVVTPGSSPVLDLGLKILTGERAEDTFKGRRPQVVSALHAAGDIVATRLLPRAFGRLLPVYRVIAVRRRGAG